MTTLGMGMSSLDIGMGVVIVTDSLVLDMSRMVLDVV